METVFLSYSFRDQDRELVKYVEGIIESHGLKSVAGDVAGGNALDPEIAKMIKEGEVRTFSGFEALTRRAIYLHLFENVASSPSLSRLMQMVRQAEAAGQVIEVGEFRFARNSKRFLRFGRNDIAWE